MIAEQLILSEDSKNLGDESVEVENGRYFMTEQRQDDPKNLGRTTVQKTRAQRRHTINTAKTKRRQDDMQVGPSIQPVGPSVQGVETNIPSLRTLTYHYRQNQNQNGKRPAAGNYEDGSQRHQVVQEMLQVPHGSNF